MEPDDQEWSPFNLLWEAWIPVLYTDGETGEVGLVDLFAQAPRVAAIQGELPTVSAALEGMLQAIYRRVTSRQYGRDRVSQVTSAITNWDNWDPVSKAAREYLGHWEHRFDLRHPAEPFYQVAGLETPKGNVSGLEVLFADVPNGEPFLSMRREKGLESLSWSEAARWLVHVQAFDPSGIRSGVVGDRRVTGGKNYPIGPAWAARLGSIMPRTGNLAHDLILAAAPAGSGGLDYEAAADLPVWERDQHTQRPEGVPDSLWEEGTLKQIREHRRLPDGPVDVLTWQSRRVRLVGDGERVTGLILTQGDPLDPHNAFTFEPRTAWRYSVPQTKKFKKTVYMPRELAPGSALWRGVESVFPISIAKASVGKGVAEAKFMGPAHSTWISFLEEPNWGGRPGLVGNVHLEALGTVLGSNQSVIDDVVESRLDFPSWLLGDDQSAARAEVASWVALAEQVASAIGRFAANLSGAAGVHETDGVREAARGEYLAAAEPEFQRRLTELDPSTTQTLPRVKVDYAETLRDLAAAQREELVAEASDAAMSGNQYGNTFMTVGKAETFLLSELRRILGVTEGETTSSEDGSDGTNRS